MAAAASSVSLESLRTAYDAIQLRKSRLLAQHNELLVAELGGLQLTERHVSAKAELEAQAQQLLSEEAEIDALAKKIGQDNIGTCSVESPAAASPLMGQDGDVEAGETLIVMNGGGHNRDGGNVLMACCVCGASIEPNPSRRCMACLRCEIDLSGGLPRNVLLPYCKHCDRWLKGTSLWVRCEPESPELLALCLKKVRGIDKVKVIDAKFVWTESHARRLRVKLTIEREIMGSATVQQTLPIEFIVTVNQCPQCKQSYTHHHWNAMVQIRQRATHKRTMIHLEQIILKHAAHENCVNIVDQPDGLDFHFGAKQDAQRFTNFVRGFFPMKVHEATGQFISHNMQNSTTRYKFTTSIEIAPICRDDLIYIPPKVSNQYFGGISSFLLCRKVTTSIQLIDPFSLRAIDIPSEKYWKMPFDPLLSRRNLTEFIILDLEDTMPQTTGGIPKRFLADDVAPRIVDAEIARLQDFGHNDDRMIVRTHLGNILKVGDIALGYDSERANLSGDNDQILDTLRFPVILVRKQHGSGDAEAQGPRQRPWALRRLAKQEGGGKLRDTKAEAAYIKDIEDFKEDIEEDADVRKNVDLWLDPRFTKKETKMTNELMGLMEGLSLNDPVL